MLKIKQKFDSFNNGVLYFGDYLENYDGEGNACSEKEFSIKGKLFFSYKTIREQDSLKYADTGLKVSIKIKTHYIPGISTGDTVKINDVLYSIAYLEPDASKEKMFIFLTDLINVMSKHISIFSKNKGGALSDDEWIHFKTVWGDIKEINTVKTLENIVDGKMSTKFRKKFIIRYIDCLDLSNNKEATSNYKILYKNKFYNILGISNLEEKDEILEIEGVIE
ncbi:phage head closure protein [uncultured Clostridium sp.]|uniref:phage head closure protein n=1 Tax=uncultured Clostridium sp. TaxID=59620 RepID=UPI002628F22D|nr:phage head closure protein [uncultured Clostridium sp.]